MDYGGPYFKLHGLYVDKLLFHESLGKCARFQ